MTETDANLYQPLIEFWHKSRCPQCGEVNWTYHSHSQRSEPIHSPDICQCRGCDARYWMMDEATMHDIYPADLYELEEDESLMDVCGADCDIGRSAPT